MPICPLTLEDGNHLKSPGSPLDTSLPIDLRVLFVLFEMPRLGRYYVPRLPLFWLEALMKRSCLASPAINVRPTPFISNLGVLSVNFRQSPSVLLTIRSVFAPQTFLN
jgi:hypothetical protein